jgi:hypothetical protein
MDSKRSRRPSSGADTAEETAAETPQVDEDSAARAGQVSADATETISAIDDALLDDAEAAMTSTLFEPGEVITRDEWDKRAEIWNTGFKQKGGQ